MEAPESGHGFKWPRPLWLFIATLGFVAGSLGLVFGWPLFCQRSALNAIETAGGDVETRQGGPTWLRKIIGNDFMRVFDEILGVAVSNASFGDSGLYWLQGQTHLKRLNLKETGVGNAGLAVLATMPRLTQLELDRTQMTDAGLAALAGLVELESLSLSDTGVSDAGIDRLRALPRLERLSLDGTAVTDAGTHSLTQCPALEVLHLRRTQITDSGLLELAKLPRLRILYVGPLTGSALTAEGITRFQQSASGVVVEW